MIDPALIKAQLDKTVSKTRLHELGEKTEGKVRDCYVRDGKRTIVVTDRISAFDVVLGTIPFKGQVLNRMAAFWFEATADSAPNHVISVPDPQVMVGRECKPLPVEFVMRSYLTGVTTTSIWSHYERGVRTFCGHKLPDGMKKNQPLEKAILTPSTKAEKGGHDESVSREQILAMKLLTAEEFEEAALMCARLFAFGQGEAARRGLILVDTKYEIGRRPDGALCFIDEIHTPDSSRYWYADDYKKRLDAGQEPRGLDKEYVRRTLAEQGYRGDGPPPTLSDEIRVEAARRYIEVCELITGRKLELDMNEPEARIRRNLGIQMTAKIYVTMKKAVLDPQGKAVQRSLAKLGFPEARDVRVGRYIEVQLETGSKDEAGKRVDEMCKKLLANTVIEDYRFELV